MTSLWDELGAAKPVHATMPTPGAVHDLGQIEVMADMLQTPLMPWQKFVARVASERDPNDPRRFRYPIVVVTVPRQSGKTTLMRCVLAQRAFMNADRVAFYTAQSGKDASARWLDLVKKIEQSPLESLVTRRMAQGSQALKFPNGSVIAPFAPTPQSLHGYTPHDVMLDEIFYWDAIQGNDLMGAIKPAQITLPDRQLWLVSTMGNSKSEFLNEWVEAGRAATKDPAANVAYFEWALPAGGDIFSQEDWAFHPALGHTIGVEDLAEAAAAHTIGEWERAYMNRRTATAETFVPMGDWDGLAGDVTAPAPSDLSLGIDVAHDGSGAAVVAAWRQSDRVAVKLVKAEQGTGWLPDFYRDFIKAHRVRKVALDPVGETRAALEEIKAAHPGAELTEMTTREYSGACIGFKRLITSKQLVHDGGEILRDAVAAVAIRPLGEGWAFSRVKSSQPVPAVVAAALATRLVEVSPAESKPLIYVPA